MYEAQQSPVDGKTVGRLSYLSRYVVAFGDGFISIRFRIWLCVKTRHTLIFNSQSPAAPNNAQMAAVNLLRAR